MAYQRITKNSRWILFLEECEKLLHLHLDVNILTRHASRLTIMQYIPGKTIFTFNCWEDGSGWGE